MRDLPLKAHERVFNERVPLPAVGARADPALRRVALRAARDADRVLGLPRRARARAACSRAGDGAHVVPRGVRADGRHAARGGARRRRDRDRALPARSRCCASCCCSATTGPTISPSGWRARSSTPSEAAEEDTMTHQILKEMRD